MEMTTTEKQSFWQRVFINRDYGLLFWGRLVSQVGDGILYFALTWLVLDLTGSGAALGTLLFVSSIPAVLLAPFSGVLADLWDRKTIVVSMDIARGLISLVVAWIFKAGLLNLPILYVATTLSALCGVLFGPAISAAIPGMVKKDELVKANALNNFSRSATMIIGPVIGAFLLGTTGYLGVFIINGVSFLLSAFSEMFIRFPQVERVENGEPQQSGGKQFIASLKEGFVYIWSNAGLRTLILFAVVLNFLGAPIFGVLFPYLGKEILKMEAQHFGFAQSALPVGFLVGTVIIGYLTDRIAKDRLLVFGIIAQGVLGALVGLLALPVIYESFNQLTMLIALATPIFFMGLFNILVNVPFQVMLQETVPDHYRGRVYGLLDSMVQMLVPISMALGGALVDRISPFYFLMLSGLVTGLLGVAMGTSADIRGMYAQEVQSEC